MLRIFINSFIRQFRQNLSFSLLNVFGLSLGISISYMIVMYVSDELSFDKFHSNGERIYRVGLKATISDDSFESIYTSAPMSEVLPMEIPGIESATRLVKQNEVVVEKDKNKYLENSVILADSNFFNFFDFKLLFGNPGTVLAAPNQIVLSESWATKYFGDVSYDKIIGETVLVGKDRKLYTITGIVENAPKNSHIRYSFLMSMTSSEISEGKIWTNNNLMTYFTAGRESDIKGIESDMIGIVDKYIGPEVQYLMGITIDEFRNQGGAYGYFAQPLYDIHLHSTYENDLSINGDYQNVVIFSIVALFVLIIAGVNFINLSTARATDRACETGVRKALGASRSQLISKFLAESILYVLISSAIAITLVLLNLDFINNLMSKAFTVHEVLTPAYMIMFFIIAISIGVLAGIYPALILSSYKTVDSLKGRYLIGQSKKFNPRNVLVGFQFTLTAIAIILTIVVQNQLGLMHTTDLGFDKEQILVIKNVDVLGDRQTTLKTKLEAMSFVKSASLTNGYPPEIRNSSVFRLGDTNEDHGFMYYQTDVDHLDVFGFELLEGKFFEEGVNNENTIVINESAKKRAGWQSIEGKTMSWFGDQETKLKVIGVVKDFHFQDFKSDISRLAIIYAPMGRFATVKIQKDKVQEAMKEIEVSWTKLTNGEPFNYTFVDRQFSELWATEEKLADLTFLFSILTIVTAGLGLFGLASYIARSRRREFGIRKILGAKEETIVSIQAFFFLKLSLSSLIVSIPVSYYLVSLWLNEFVYRIPNDYSIYLKAIALIICIIIVSVGYQLLKSAKMSPIDVLRSDL